MRPKLPELSKHEQDECGAYIPLAKAIAFLNTGSGTPAKQFLSVWLTFTRHPAPPPMVGIDLRSIQ